MRHISILFGVSFAISLNEKIKRYRLSHLNKRWFKAHDAKNSQIWKVDCRAVLLASIMVSLNFTATHAVAQNASTAIGNVTGGTSTVSSSSCGSGSGSTRAL